MPPPVVPTPTDELFIAAARNDQLAVRTALERGGDPGAELSNGMTPLHVALDCAGELAVTEELADRGLSEQLLDGVLDRPQPGVEDRLSVVRALLAAGASTSRQDDRGQTPIHCAVQFPVLGVISELLAAGADPGTRDLNGMTPLHLLAIFSDDAAAAEALIDAGADVNAKDGLERRPIDYTGVWEDQVELPAALIRAGASTAGVDKSWRRRVARNMLDRSRDQGKG